MIKAATLKQLEKALQTHGTKDEHEFLNGELYTVYQRDELTVAYGPGGKLTGLNFEVLGMELTLLPNRQLTISTLTETGQVEVQTVTDKPFMEQVEKFLLWRGETLRLLAEEAQ